MIGWFLTSLIGYLYLHKPFEAEQFLLWLTSGWQIFIAMLMVSFSGGIGHALLQTYPTGTKITDMVLQVALGVGIVAAGLLFFGTLTLNPVILALIIGSLALLIRKNIIAWLEQWKALPTILPNSFFTTIIAGICFMILLLALLTTITPPVRFDALTYHISIPASYLQYGKIVYLPENVFWGMPQLVELNYLLGMAFGGQEIAAILGWAYGSLAVLGLLDFTAHNFGRTAAWVAVGSLLAGETFASALSWAYVDWAVILYGYAFLVYLSVWNKERKIQYLILNAVFVGLALSTKYTAGILLIAGAVFILQTRQSLKTIMSQLIVFSSITVLVFSPWLLKNLLATGSPIYPLLFPAGAMDSLRILKYHLSPASNNWWLLLTLPWHITIWGVEGKVGPGASVGPLFLALSPFAYLQWKEKNSEEKSVLRVASIITISCFLVSAIGSQFAGLLSQTRLFLALFPAWTILVAAGYKTVNKINTNTIRFGKLANPLVILPISFCLLSLSMDFGQRSISPYLLGVLPKKQFYLNNLGTYHQAIQGIEALPNKKRVLFLWETRNLACLTYCDGDEIIDRWYHDWRRLKNINEILSEWKSLGFTHVLYYKQGADFIRKTEKRKYNASDWQGLDAMLTLLGEPSESFGDHYLLFTIPTLSKP